MHRTINSTGKIQSLILCRRGLTKGTVASTVACCGSPSVVRYKHLGRKSELRESGTTKTKTRMEGMDNGNGSSGNSGNGSKRQMLYDFVRKTKEVYIPNIRQMTSKPYMPDGMARDGPSDISNSQYPENMFIQYYPSYYTRNDINDGRKALYDVVIRLNILEPGDITRRRNRVLLSLCKQYLKPGNSDPDAIQSETDLSQAKGFNEEELETLTNRIQGFLCARVPGAPLLITLHGDTPNDIHKIEIQADNIGYVETSVMTEFEPRRINITVQTPDYFPAIVTKDVSNLTYIKQDGWGLISDIDDTIKHTGITGNKKSMFRNVFVHEFERWKIDGMPSWYYTLRDVYNFDFFYVSNSPLQLYPVLVNFIESNYPRGPIFLKQYTGNFMKSLMTSSANRKSGKIRSILEDFPNKKFILVGDSGEQDLEAYIKLACEFPDQIRAIFIRCCSNSLSDFSVEDKNIMKTLNELIQRLYFNKSVGSSTTSLPISRKSFRGDLVDNIRKIPPLPLRRRTTAEVARPVDSFARDTPVSRRSTTDRLRRPPPPIPNKRIQLSREQEESIMATRHLNSDDHKSNADESPKRPPALPPRRTDSTLYDTIQDKSSLSPSASSISSSAQSSVSEGFFIPSSQNDMEGTGTIVDKRADNWQGRVINAIDELKSANVNVHFAFFMEPELCLEDSLSIIESTKERTPSEK